MNLKLTEANLALWFHNLQVFLAPVGIIYLGSVYVIISQVTHIIVAKDFVPSTYVVGAAILYFINAALDYLRKLKSQ